MTKSADMSHVAKVQKSAEATLAYMKDDVPAALLIAFYIAAQNEGMGVVEMAQLMGAKRTKMSRYLLDLSDTLRNGSEGHKLLQRHQDPSNMRGVYYTLTPKGHLALRKLKEAMEE